MLINLVAVAASRARPTQPPSFVLMMADDMGAGDPGYAGGGAATPQLDAWSRSNSSLVLRRSYAMNVCSPSRAALLTGRHSDRMCVWTADTNALPRFEFTIAEAARQAGMATFHSGKWHVGAMSGRVQDEGLCGCNRSKSTRLPNHEKLWPRDCESCAPGTSCTISGLNRTGPYACLPPTPSCPLARYLPWSFKLFNLTADPKEERDIGKEQPELLGKYTRQAMAFAKSVIESQGKAENNCAKNFGPAPQLLFERSTLSMKSDDAAWPLVFGEASGGGPSSPNPFFRVSVCAARTLNATGPSRSLYRSGKSN